MKKKTKKSKLTKLERHIAKLPVNKYACDCVYQYDYVPPDIMIIRHSVYLACGKCRRPLTIAISLEEARKVQEVIE